MTGLDVLITSSYYWPEPAGNAPYATGVAEHLAALGHRVVVATGFPHYPAWRSGARGRLAAREERNGVEVRRRWHYVPKRQSAARRAAYEGSLLAFGLTALAPRRPDVILGLVPSLAGGMLAAVAARAYRRPYVLVFQDLVGLAAAQSGIGGGRSVASLAASAELAAARGAVAVGIVGESFRPYLENGGVAPASIVRLRNWAQPIEPTETVVETRARLGWGPGDFVCLHAGNMGHKQALDNVLGAAGLMRSREVQVVLAGDGNERGRLQRRAAELGLRNVTFVGAEPPGRYEAMLRAADVLILNQRGSLRDMSLPSKLTSYFAAGRPVVAAISSGSEAAVEVMSAGGGVVVPPDVPSALAAAILEIRSSPVKAGLLGAAGRRYAETTLPQAAALADYERLLERACGWRVVTSSDGLPAPARPTPGPDRIGAYGGR
jgi:colanic acid biosynthesis glycosyl transferase WcaI